MTDLDAKIPDVKKEAAKATPGPWRVIALGASVRIVANGVAVAQIQHNKFVQNNRTEANARLIAAAPDMLALLQSFVTYQVDYMTRNHLGDPERQHNIKWARQLFAQIKGEA